MDENRTLVAIPKFKPSKNINRLKDLIELSMKLEERIDATVGQVKNDGYSLREIAKYVGVPNSTLADRYGNGKRKTSKTRNRKWQPLI